MDILTGVCAYMMCVCGVCVCVCVCVCVVWCGVCMVCVWCVCLHSVYIIIQNYQYVRLGHKVQWLYVYTDTHTTHIK